MKRLFLSVLSLVILLGSTCFAGSFYNPDPEELKEKGREAAEKLNESFVNFYQMLRNIEGRKFDIARGNKKEFDGRLEESLTKFDAVYKATIDAPLRFQELNQELRGALNHIQRKYLKNQPINTTKKLVKIPITMIEPLLKKSLGFQIKPEKKDFFTQLRSLILIAIDVQWIGVRVSELWVHAKY